MKKAFCLLLTLCISLCLPSTYIRAEESSQDKALNIADFALPEELGKIDSRFAGTSERWVILIQDIHGHLTAQENISAIVDHLSQVYGIDTIGIEGGWSKTKLSKSRQVPNSRSKQQLARALIEEEYITGPFYSALFSEKPLKLIGIENKDLYLKNREIFLAQIDSREDSLKKLTAAEKKITALKKETYHPELLDFDAALSAFREGRKAEDFMPSLISTAETLGADLADLDQIQLFKEILKTEKDLNREKLAVEAKRLTAAASNPRLSFEEILRSGQTPPEQLSHYPEILKFQEILKLQDTLSHHAFFAQIETTIKRVKEKLFQNDAEKALDEKSERFSLIKKLITLQAVPEDFKKSSEQKETLLNESAEAGLSEPLERGAKFYKLAQKRDAIFFTQITKQPLLAGNIAVVAGGFHAEGLTARLERDGISYMIITPSLGQNAAPPNEELYFKRMRDGAALIPSQTLSHLANRPFTKSFDLGFVAGVNVMKATNDQREAVKTVLNFHGLVSPSSKNDFPGMTVESFMSLTGEEQKSIFEEWLKIFEKPGTQKIILGYKTPVLGAILKTSEGFTFFKKYIAPDKKTTLGELRGDDDEYLSELLGLKQPIRISIDETTDPADALLKKFQKGAEKPLIALLDPTYKSDRLLVLPQNPASLMLARLLLENKISGNVTREFINRMIELMKEVFEARGVIEKAA